MSEQKINKALPGWEVTGVLGSGPFGTTYLAQGSAEGSAVFSAVKVIKAPPTEDAIKSAESMGISKDLLKTYFGKFKSNLNWELTMFRTISSLNLIPIDDLVIDDVEGPGWTAYIRTGIYTPMSVYFSANKSDWEDAVRLGSELSIALDRCGEYGMVHGEIKPENVFLTDSGSFVLSDFGIRRCLEPAGTNIFGEVSTEFDAPELSDNKTFTQSSDIYSLGMLMNYVAAGGALPPDNDPDNIDGIDPGVAAIIKKATAKEPAERYRSAMELKNAISRLNLKLKAPRRSVAAVAAFNAVKKNGGTIKTENRSGSTIEKNAAVTVSAAAESNTIRNASAENKPTIQQSDENDFAAPLILKDNFKYEQSAKYEEKSQPKTTKKAKNGGSIKRTLAVSALVAVIVAALILLLTQCHKDGENRDIQNNNENIESADNREDNNSENTDIVTPDDKKDVQDDNTGDDTVPPEDDTEDNKDDTENKGEDKEDGKGEDENSDNTETGDTTDKTPEDDTDSTGDDTGNEGTNTDKNTGGNENKNTATSNDILFPSDTTLITKDDLEGKSQSELAMLINEIYARHGKIFKTASIQDYFESQKWYKPVTKDSSVIEKKFNDTEKDNIKTLTDYQKELGYRAGGKTKNTETVDPAENTTSADTPTPSDNGETTVTPEKEETPAEPEEDVPTVEKTRNDTILPTDTVLITLEDVDGMSSYESYMAINEIYARHGKIFKDAAIQAYFDSQVWYTRVTEDSKVIVSQLTEIENTNLHIITAYQKNMGYR